jgi:hypothetical protein
MSAIRRVTTIEQHLIDDFVAAIPTPDTWQVSQAEIKNTAIRESRGMVFRFQDTDRPVDPTLSISDTENRTLYPQIEPLLNLATSTKYGTELGRVRISCLPPGAKVAPHIDRGRYFEIHNRLMFPLTTNPKCSFWLDGKGPYRPEVGCVYYFDNQKKHRSVNNGSTYRMFLMVDVR